MTELEERLQRENAALRHGLAPELLADVPVDRVEHHASLIRERLDQASARPAPGQQPAGALVPGQNGYVPAPVPSDNAATAAESAEERDLRQMRYKVRQRTKFGPRTLVDLQDVEQFRDTAFRIAWNNHQRDRRRGRGDVSEPPRGTPAGAPVALPPMGASF